MKIKETTAEEIKVGKNWKILDPNEFAESELEDLTIVEHVDFSADDYVVYSGIFVADSGDVTPMILIKEVGAAEHGGDMCEMVGGKWQRFGATPKPDSNPFGSVYVANPLRNDPSFDTGDAGDGEWSYNRQQFNKWAQRIVNKN